MSGEFHGSLLVRTPHFHCLGGMGSVPDQGTKLWHNRKQQQRCQGEKKRFLSKKYLGL